MNDLLTSRTFFPDSYALARDAFRSACAAAQSPAVAYEHPTEVGIEGETLATDVTWFGSEDAENVLFCLSGTHGPEGFAGSVAQTAWVHRGGYQALPNNVAVCLVHGVNPYGFSHTTRYTENNVDMNRNWIDFSKPLPVNEAYSHFFEMLTPTSLSKADEDRIFEWLQRQAVERGLADIEDALTRGQYSHPRGGSFGGQAPEWSRVTLESIARTHLSGAKRVFLLDWHTGTPGIGGLIYLCYCPSHHPMFTRTAAIWGHDKIDPRKVDEQWGNKRPGRMGLMYWGLSEIFETLGADLAGGIIEIGTRETNDIASAPRSELYDNYLRFEGNRLNTEGRRMRRSILESYYRPDQELWRKAVIEKSWRLFERTLAGLADWGQAGDLKAAD